MYSINFISIQMLVWLYWKYSIARKSWNQFENKVKKLTFWSLWPMTIEQSPWNYLINEYNYSSSQREKY